MIIARLCISFDRGMACNRPSDLKAEAYRGKVTDDGKVIRGLGTHFRSVEAREKARELSAKEQNIRNAFKRRFVAAPIPGCVILPESGAGKALLAKLDIPEEMRVGISEFKLDVAGDGLGSYEVREWADRIKSQLEVAPLGRGRGKYVKDENLDMLDGIADCPALAPETRAKLKELISGARLKQIEKSEVRRALENLEIEIDPTMIQPDRSIDTISIDSVEVETGEVSRSIDSTVDDVAIVYDDAIVDAIDEADAINAALDGSETSDSADPEPEPVPEPEIIIDVEQEIDIANLWEI